MAIMSYLNLYSQADDPYNLCDGYNFNVNLTHRIPNPSFEQISCCPEAFGGFFHCVNDWYSPSELGSPDFYHTCGWYPPPFENFGLLPFPDGQGITAALFGQSIKEFITTCLNGRLNPGEELLLSLDISYFSSDGYYELCVDQTLHPPIDIVVYGINSCENMYYEWLGDCPPVGNPDWHVIGSASYTPGTHWSTLTIPLNITQVIYGITIGPPCDLPANYPVGGPCIPAFFFDNLRLYEGEIPLEVEITEEGHVCTAFSIHAQTNIPGGEWQWYLENTPLQGQTSPVLELTENDLPAGTYYIRYVVDGLCTLGSFVFDNDSYDLFPICPPEMAICISDDPPILQGSQPGDGIFSGTGITDNLFHPSVAGIGDHTISYNVTDVYGCTGVCTFTIHVQDHTVLTCPAEIEVCGLVEAFIIQDGIPGGGTFSGTGINNNLFSPQEAGFGEHEIEYTYHDGICSQSCLFRIKVYEEPEPDCPGLNQVCIDDPVFPVLSPTPAGGVFSGPGVIGDSFDPELAGLGDHIISYVYTDSNQCNGSCDFVIRVNVPQTIDCPEDLDICLQSSEYYLSSEIPGGTFSGTGVNQNIFYPSTTGQGQFTLFYTIELDACESVCEFKVNVIDTLLATCPSLDPVCLSTTSFAITDAAPSGGFFVGPGVLNDMFNPALAGIGIHELSYQFIDSEGCVYSCITSIEVQETRLAECPVNIHICSNSAPFLLDNPIPSGGTFSGTGLTANEFNPGIAGPGVHLIEYLLRDDQGCDHTCQFEITVHEIPEIVPPADLTVCESAGSIPLSGGQPAGGYFIGPFISNNTFDAIGSGPGIFSITYSFTNSHGCQDSDEFSIEVFESVYAGEDASILCFASDTAIIQFDGSGIWSIISGGDATLDISGAQTLRVYDFSQAGEYILVLESGDICADTLIISVGLDCPCLILGNSISTPITQFCESADFIQITGSIPDPPGGTYEWVWSPDGVNYQIFPGIADGQNLTTGTLGPGVYYFRRRYTIDQDCRSLSNTIIIRVIQKLNAGQQMLFPSFCSDDDSIIELLSLLQDRDSGGSWEEVSAVPSGPGAFDPINVSLDIHDQLPGEYIFRYIIDNEAPCGPDTSYVSIVIHPSPEAVMDIDPSEIINCINTFVQLTTIRDDLHSYQWFKDGIEISIDTFIQVSSIGHYELQVTDLISGCASSTGIQITEEIDYPFTYISPPDTLSCKIALVTLDASSSQTSDRIIHEWYDSNGIIIPNNNSLFLDVNLSDNYRLISTDTINGCNNFFEVFVPENYNLPQLDAGDNIPLYCGNDLTRLSATAQTHSGQLQIVWHSITGSILSGLNTLRPEVKGQAWYFITVSDPVNGCIASDSVFVSVSQESFSILSVEVDTICFSDASGNIKIVTDGQAPVQFFLNGQLKGETGIISNIPPGDHLIKIIDANGCERDTILSIQKRGEWIVEMVPQILITQGDTVQIQVSTGIDPSLIDSIWWVPSEFVLCDTCLHTGLFPSSDQRMEVWIRDIWGCVAHASTFIVVKRKIRVFIPDAFSPNGDGINDGFTLYGSEISEIIQLEVFDRWGNRVFEKQNFPPNIPSEGWDGNFRSKVMDPTSFVYAASVRIITGEFIKFSGELILMR